MSSLRDELIEAAVLPDIEVEYGMATARHLAAKSLDRMVAVLDKHHDAGTGYHDWMAIESLLDAMRVQPGETPRVLD